MRFDDVLVFRCLVGGVSLVLSDDDGVISLVRLEGELLWLISMYRLAEPVARSLTLRLDALLSHDVDLAGEHLRSRGGRVDTVGLDGDDNGSAVLQEVVSVQRNDTGLVRLSDIGKDDVDHLNEHSVLLRVSGVLDNGDNVCSLLGHANEISA